MNADIEGSLNQLNKSYQCFEHKGKRLTKEQVKAILEFGKKKGYKHAGQITDSEADSVLKEK